MNWQLMRKSANALSNSAIVERAKSMANDWMWAIDLQLSRIKSPRLQDADYHSFGVNSANDADIHFLVISLARLRRIAVTIEHVPTQWENVHLAINNFDARLPWLKRMRDVFEHLEDYAVDSNLKRSSTSRRELQVWSLTDNGIHWLGFDINWEESRAAAIELHASIKSAYDSFLLSARVEEGAI